jgi:hypothetical protein
MMTKDTQNIREAKDEIFESFAVTPHMRAETIAEAGDKTRKVPAVVAAPFPPLNFSHIGYTCPTTQKKLVRRAVL